MKPLEVQGTLDTEGEMECEFQSKEFFVKVGMLVIDGRTPQRSDKGRIEGKHCASLKGNASHVCEQKDKECQEAHSWVSQMEHYWHSTNDVVIDVLVQLKEESSAVLLLEQWTISIINSSNSPSMSGSQLLQAVRSHIHFSQLSAWLSLSRGVLPYNIKYRINEEGDYFIQEPVLHAFPLACLPGHRWLQVTVKSLPRCSMQDLLDALESTQTSQNNLDTQSPLRKRTCLKKVESQCERTRTKPSKMKDLYDSCLQRRQSNNLEDDFTPLKSLGNGNASNVGQSLLHRNVLHLGASCSNWESNGIGNLNDRIEKLGRDIDQIERKVHQTDKRFSGLSKLLKDSPLSAKLESNSQNVLSKESILDKKTNFVNDGKRLESKDISKMLLQRKYHSLNEQDGTNSNGAACKQINSVCDNRQNPTRKGTASNSSDVDIHAIKKPVDRACFRRSVQLPIGACTEPVFNPKTGLPVSSSPAPLRRSTNELYEDTTDFSDGLSNKVDYRELSKLLSRSAPASTTQSLLVNFEESVLNGRMEPVGTVEGFTAELSASGSFCPRHVKLPIISCFYRLSDDDAPSPYMGYISLKDEPLGRRGYHVPKRGTIQLTVFNPNKTVVKMFVVLYDCSDMPPKSQTFLRQKTYSALKGNVVKNEVQQTLHYLLHLRFASSKSGKLYLHTDIRVIFARQPPDLGHLYQLYTVTDGPTDPKYTKRHHTSMDPEC